MTPDLAKRLILLLAALAVAAPVVAADPDGESGDWTAPAAPPPGDVVPKPPTPEGGYADPDRVRFDEKLRDKVLDQLCRHLRITYDYKPDLLGFAGTSLGVTRHLAPEPGGRLSVVDDEKLRLSWGESLSRPVAEGGPSASFGVSATLEGHSVVVRRLGTTKTCDEVDRLIDLRDIKTVLPFTAERISKMAVGELWRVPFTMSVGYGASLSEALGENAAASLSFGYSKGGTQSTTLYRMADDKLRFRFRIDYVTVRSRSLSAGVSIPAAQFLVGWEGALLRLADKTLARELAKIAIARLDLGSARSDGQKMVLEYVVDPRDPEQALAVQQAFRGDFRRLLKSARRIATSHVTAADTDPAYEELRNITAGHLGPPGHAAVEEYTFKARSFGGGLPLLIWGHVHEVYGRSAVTELTGEGGEFRFYPSDRSPSGEFLRMPFVGPLVKENGQRRVEVVTHAPKGQAHGEPLMVYIRNHGVLRVPGSSVAETVHEMNSVLRLAGARRGADGSRLVLPDSMIPVPTPVAETHGPRENHGPTEVSDRKGTVSLTLVFNQKAVRDAVSAASKEMLEALAASMGPMERPMMEWLAANGRIEGSRLVYDRSAAGERFPEEGAANDLRTLSLTAAGLVTDLAAARDADSNDHRAEALSSALGGRGKSGLSYEKVLRVMVQFVDPLDLTGDFVASVKNSSKGGKDTEGHLVLKQGRAEVPLLRGAGEARARFAEPSVLYD